MRKFLPYIKPIICLVLCIAVCVAFACLAFLNHEEVNAEEEAVLTLWQIDSFEGGKGSRADYLKKAGENFCKAKGCYISVVALSAQAARLSLAEGNVPDIISFGAGTYGLENYINNYKTWCYGGYCFLTLESGADFSDINSENTIINGGKENLSSAAALLCGVRSAAVEKPTGAYVKLINGNYKYLLGTQRDIFRLKTRGVSFSVKPITQFNDLYQNISVTANSKHAAIANAFIEYLLTVTDDITKLGMMSDKTNYDDEMKLMQGIEYESKLTAPVSEQTRKQLENIISEGDINMLKNLLK